MRHSQLSLIMLASGSALLLLSSLCAVCSTISYGSATVVRTWCLPVWQHSATLFWDAQVAVAVSVVCRVTNYHVGTLITQCLDISPRRNSHPEPQTTWARETFVAKVSCVRACVSSGVVVAQLCCVAKREATLIAIFKMATWKTSSCANYLLFCFLFFNYAKHN